MCGSVRSTCAHSASFQRTSAPTRREPGAHLRPLGVIQARTRHSPIRARAPTRLVDQGVQQVVELGGGVRGRASVHGAGLEHRDFGAPAGSRSAGPSGFVAAAPPRSSPAQTPSTKSSASQTWSRSTPGSHREQPVPVDVPRGGEEVGGLAVEHHADVEELLAVHARHAAQHDVLVGQAPRSCRHPRRQPLAGAEPGGRGRRRTPRARRPASPRPAPARATRRAPAPAPRRRPARPSRAPTSASTAGSASSVADQHVVVGVPGLRRELRRVAARRRASRGGSTARPRGRSPRGRRARAAGWGCATSGRRSRRTRPARAPGPPPRAPGAARRRSRRSPAGSRRRG